MSIRKVVYNHCQMNENQCSNQEIHVLIEHGSELEKLEMSMTLYGKRCGPD